MSEQPYDPYIPSGSNGAGASAATEQQQQNGDPKTREIDRVSHSSAASNTGRVDIFSVSPFFMLQSTIWGSQYGYIRLSISKSSDSKWKQQFQSGCH